MHRPVPRQDSFSYEDVCLSVRILVQAKRSRGIKWEDSLKDVGADLGVSWTMIRTVFYRLRDLSPTAHDWIGLRERIADHLEREAAELIRQADEFDRKAAALRRGSIACASAGIGSKRGSAGLAPASCTSSNGG